MLSRIDQDEPPSTERITPKSLPRKFRGSPYVEGDGVEREIKRGEMSVHVPG